MHAFLPWANDYLFAPATFCKDWWVHWQKFAFKLIFLSHRICSTNSNNTPEDVYIMDSSSKCMSSIKCHGQVSGRFTFIPPWNRISSIETYCGKREIFSQKMSKEAISSAESKDVGPVS